MTDQAPNVPPGGDLLVWQLVDSAFPTGGFAHSSGLEAAWQHGEVRGRAELVTFAEANLDQLGNSSLPLVMAAWQAPAKLGELDALCDVFLANHVANRASRAQGRALQTAVERIWNPEPNGGKAELPFGHYAPVLGYCLGRLNVPRETVGRMFFSNQLRSLLAAAVRLNIIGPMEAQILQHRLAPKLEAVWKACENLTPEDLAQTSPLLEVWQGAQDRLYSRLFQS